MTIQFFAHLFFKVILNGKNSKPWLVFKLLTKVLSEINDGKESY